MSEWIKIFPSITDALNRIAEGRPQLLIVRGKKICIVRRQEKFHGIQDRCTHNGESLSKGTVNYLGEIICPWHGYRFRLTTGRESDERSTDLEVYPVREGEDGVFIAL